MCTPAAFAAACVSNLGCKTRRVLHRATKQTTLASARLAYFKPATSGGEYSIYNYELNSIAITKKKKKEGFPPLLY